MVLKLGGELIENDSGSKAMGKAWCASAAALGPLVVVHGGGREIDAALAQAGIPKRQVDGLRVTDRHARHRRLGAGRDDQHEVRRGDQRRGGKAVGLTGADAGVAPVRKGGARTATERRNGRPGPGRHPEVGRAARRCSSALPGRLRAGGGLRERRQGRQVIQRQRRHVGGKSGGAVEGQGAWSSPAPPPACSTRRTRRSPTLNAARIEKLVTSGTANAGMVAKLAACQAALKGGVRERA